MYIYKTSECKKMKPTHSDTLTLYNKNINQEKYLNGFLDDVSIMINETSY
jgi:hypothetical protein